MNPLKLQLEDLYFYGKLHLSRDFISSDNLTHSDKIFWENWFGKCANSHKLIPFAGKINHTHTQWLFYVSLLDITYVGLAAQSKDTAGRQYPFILFGKWSSNDLNHQFLSEQFSQLIDPFLNCITSGKLEDLYQTMTPSSINPTYLDSINSRGYLNKPFHWWISVDQGQILEHCGDATCSLYNKIFGA